MLTTRESGHVSISRELLAEIPVIRPEHVKDRWQGIRHGDLVDCITKQAGERNLKIEEESWFVNGPNRSCLQGSLRLKLPNLKDPAKDVAFSLGVIHSNNADIALRFAVGAYVFICKNGVVTGDFVLSRKHTIGLELPEQVSRGLDRYLEEVKNIKPAILNMKKRGLVTEDVDRILMRAGREGLMPWSRIGLVDKEYGAPRFKEFKPRNGWSLYNAFTYIEQKCRPRDQIQAMRLFKDLVLN